MPLYAGELNMMSRTEAAKEICELLAPADRGLRRVVDLIEPYINDGVFHGELKSQLMASGYTPFDADRCVQVVVSLAVLQSGALQ